MEIFVKYIYHTYYISHMHCWFFSNGPDSLELLFNIDLWSQHLWSFQQSRSETPSTITDIGGSPQSFYFCKIYSVFFLTFFSTHHYRDTSTLDTLLLGPFEPSEKASINWVSQVWPEPRLRPLWASCRERYLPFHDRVSTK